MPYTRNDIVNQARSYIGTYWRQFGRSRAGVDCIGLIVCVCRDLDIPVKDRPDYQKRIPDGEIFRNEIISQSDPGDPNRLLHGTLLMLRQPAYPCHCAIVATDTGPTPTMIHASMQHKKVVEESLLNFLPLIVRVREFPGVI